MKVQGIKSSIAKDTAERLLNRAVILLLIFLIVQQTGSAVAQTAEFFTLKGHGGPIMDIAVSVDSGQIASASFDNSVGLWTGRNPKWLEGHDAAVNVVEFIDVHRVVSAGDDNKIIIWDRQSGRHTSLEGHTGKVMELAISPDKMLVASASWDGSIGLWPVEEGEPVFLNGHRAGVSSLAFSGDGSTLYSASVDGTVRLWDVETRAEKRTLVRNGFGVNKIILGGNDADGAESWLAYGAVDGATRVIDIKSSEQIGDFSLDRRPILALAQDANGRRLAVGDGEGFITIIDVETWRIERDFKAAIRGPIWALDFSPDGKTVLAGGIENIVYAWPIDSLAEFDPMADTKPAFLRDPAKMSNGERQFARKCSICHSLTADGGRKAGPTLFKIFGRSAGTIENYSYSDILNSSDIVWNEETIGKLFELGPDHYIPGSKMPMQRIVGQQDRADLIEFLKHESN